MDKGILLVFCSFITLVQNFPVQLIDYVDPATGNLEVLEVIDDDYFEAEHKQNKKSILGPCLQTQNGDVRCFFEDEDRKANFEENLKWSTLPYTGEDFETFFDSQDYVQQGPVYEQDLRNLEYPMNIEDIAYVNPSSIELNSNSLNEIDGPLPNYGTYIHGLVPSQDEAPVFNGNIYESQNMPFNLRMARKASSYDEFLAQLNHDSMMNNILPTMSYVRSTGGVRGYQVPYGEAQAVASYPHAGPTGCAQPLLFGCSPSIYQGSLSSWPSIYSHTPTPVVQIPLSYKPEHALAKHKTGHYKVKPAVVLPSHNYRKANVKLVPEKKL